MRHLRRHLAPVPDEAWSAIEVEARRALKTYLSARRLIDFSGPHGFDHAAVNLGRARAFDFEHRLSAGPAVNARLREVTPLLELRVPFELPLRELEDMDRGATDLDLGSVVEAARALAYAEDRAVFYGVKSPGYEGMVPGSPYSPVALSDDPQNLAPAVSSAIACLREAGVDGPYVLALDAATYTAMLQTTGPGGYPVLQHVGRLLDGPAVWAPALDGALVVSMRGGDFEMVVGQDISVGYLEHGAESVSFYLEESLVFRLLGPEASVPMRRAHG